MLRCVNQPAEAMRPATRLPTATCTQIESQRQVQQQAAAEAQARSRVAKVKTDLEQRTAALERHMGVSGEAGRLIEAHAAVVDAAIIAINGQLATGMDWTDIERYAASCAGHPRSSALSTGRCVRERRPQDTNVRRGIPPAAPCLLFAAMSGLGRVSPV